MGSGRSGNKPAAQLHSLVCAGYILFCKFYCVPSGWKMLKYQIFTFHQIDGVEVCVLETAL